jgi:hypothetical protein
VGWIWRSLVSRLPSAISVARSWKPTVEVNPEWGKGGMKKSLEVRLHRMVLILGACRCVGDIASFLFGVFLHFRYPCFINPRCFAENCKTFASCVLFFPHNAIIQAPVFMRGLRIVTFDVCRSFVRCVGTPQLRYQPFLCRDTEDDNWTKWKPQILWHCSTAECVLKLLFIGRSPCFPSAVKNKCDSGLLIGGESTQRLNSHIYPC